MRSEPAVRGRHGAVGQCNHRHCIGLSLIYKIVLGLGVLSAVLTVGALVYTVLAWKNSYWGIAARVLLHAGDGRGGRFCLVPELLEPVGLAVLVGKRFKAGGDDQPSPPANNRKRRNLHVNSSNPLSE